MWKDYENDIIKKVFSNIDNRENVPYLCPVCGSRDMHFYMHIHNNDTRRGGLWIWCGGCHSFSHSSAYIPEYWRNCSLIEKEKLCAVPDYLEDMKTEIDKHTNVIIKEKPQSI